MALERVEAGWRLLPREVCLKNRWLSGPPPRLGLRRRWRVAPEVVEGRFESRILLYRRDRDQIFALDGPAAEMWSVLAAWGDLEAAVELLAELYDAPGERLLRDLEEFRRELAEAGLLEEMPDEVVEQITYTELPETKREVKVITTDKRSRSVPRD